MTAKRIGFDIDEVREHRLWFSRFGTMMIAIGIAVVCASAFATSALFGWLLLSSAACQFVHSFARRRWSGFLLNFPSGILYFLSGLLLVCDSSMSAETRVRILAALLIAIGIIRIFVALSIPMGHHSLLVLHAVIAAISGFSIWTYSAVSALWMIGLLIGLNIVMEGIAEIALSRTIY